MEQSSGNKTGNEPVSFLSCSKDFSTNNQNTEQHITTTPNKEMTTPPLNTATPLNEERLMRDDQTNELYLPLTSTVVLKHRANIALYLQKAVDETLLRDDRVIIFHPYFIY